MATFALDCETYPNFFLAVFRDVGGDTEHRFHAVDGMCLTREDVSQVQNLVTENRIVTFNGEAFDLPILSAACTGASTYELHGLAQSLITTRDRPKVHVKPKEHVDLFALAPAPKASLKIYGARIGCKRLQDLPIAPDTELSLEERAIVTDYCANSDIPATIALYHTLKEPIHLREILGARIGESFLAKADAQIAARVIGKALGRPQKPPTSDFSFRYAPPPFLKFRSRLLRSLLASLQALEFGWKDGKVYMPQELTDLVLPIGASSYSMGIGGLHSCEKSRAVIADDAHGLRDLDVTSYYPSIIINNGYAPEHLGREFLNILAGIKHERVEHKRAGHKSDANSLKIVINAAYGNMGSQYSFLFSPKSLVHTTITGQLSLLMLIERLELAGIPVISANTDGIVVHYPRDREAEFMAIANEWQRDTFFELEATDYAALYSRDVNNYIAVKICGGTKGKGAFAHHWKDTSPDASQLSKNPTGQICVEAVHEFLEHGTPVEDTIELCKDLKKFVFVRSVTGGASIYHEQELLQEPKAPTPIGKSVRWYYSNETFDTLHATKTGNKVPGADRVRVCQVLPDDFPSDIDYARYIITAKKALTSLGA